MKTAATNKRIREIITSVREGKLIPRPDFQRRLVWTQKDKNHFLDTVLRSMPFPEIYLADSEVDLQTGTGAQLVVDGLQRVNTLVEYFEGSPALSLLSVPAYESLTDDSKRQFLQYEVAVRDLGAITAERIVEVFQRINATKYSLNDIEINNALYAGELKQYAAQIAERRFFEQHGVFSATDLRRMGDLRFALSVVITYLAGYFNRDDDFGEYLARYNDALPLKDELDHRLTRTIEFIEECGFAPSSRVWKKADLFTLLVELDILFRKGEHVLQPSDMLDRLELFFTEVGGSGDDNRTTASIYAKAALQATNDRVNRLRRGIILSAVLRGHSEEMTMGDLRGAGVLKD